MAFEEVIIGDARLIHGDCREVLPLLPAFDLVLTDPPYGTGGWRRDVTGADSDLPHQWLTTAPELASHPIGHALACGLLYTEPLAP